MSPSGRAMYVVKHYGRAVRANDVCGVGLYLIRVDTSETPLVHSALGLKKMVEASRLGTGEQLTSCMIATKGVFQRGSFA